MQMPGQISWKFGALAGVAVALITLIPQIGLWVERGSQWHGTYALSDPDELVYSAYLSSVLEGQPRTNNPYLGSPLNRQAAQKKENYFSIQFLPVWVLSLFASMFSVSASTVFILMLPFFSFASTMAAFWLFREITSDDRFAAIGALILHLCGFLLSESPVAVVQNFMTLAFSRRYIPGAAFPLIFVFCVLVWRAFTRPSVQAFGWSATAGVTLGLIVYSYFYLWTAASAWLICLSGVWLASRAADRKRIATRVITGSLIAGILSIPYFLLLMNRVDTLDKSQALVLTRAPDLFRFSEIVGICLILFIAWSAWRGVQNIKSPQVLFCISFALTPMMVFNQQVITGHSLQPFHYEQFVINYLVLTGVILTYRLIWWHVRIRPAIWISFALILGIAIGLKTLLATSQINRLRDEAVPALKRFKALSNKDPQGIILCDPPWLAASAPTVAPMHVLWSPYSYTFGSTTPPEEMERFYQYLYLKGADGPAFRGMLEGEALYRRAVFGLDRENSKLTGHFQPISALEIDLQVNLYLNYVEHFSEVNAARWPVSFVLTDQTFDFSSLDQWYQRDNGERFGNFTLYRVRLRRNMIERNKQKAR